MQKFLENRTLPYFDCIQGAVAQNLSRLIRYSCIFAACSSPALIGRFALYLFKRDNAVKLCNGIMFNFYVNIQREQYSIHTLTALSTREHATLLLVLCCDAGRSCDTDSYVSLSVPTLHCEKPSPKRIISAIMAESGTIMAMGRNMLFKLSGSSVRPA